jgi:Asp/Glu/hydantoin racemase
MQQRQPRVGLVHATSAAMEPIQAAFARHLPQVVALNVLDEGLLDGLNQTGSLTPALIRRLGVVVSLAESAGVEAILMTCSSYSPVVETMRALSGVPVLPVDEVLIEEAVSVGERLGVVATVPAAVGTTTRGLEAEAARRGRSVHVVGRLAAGAFEALAASDAARHDALIADAVRRLVVDDSLHAVVLAQASMTRALPAIGDLAVPVLTSPVLGVQRVAQVLGLATSAPAR